MQTPPLVYQEAFPKLEHSSRFALQVHYRDAECVSDYLMANLSP